MLPFLTRYAPWFTFIGHPRHGVDLERIGGTALLRRYSISEDDFFQRLGLIPPLVIGNITFEAQAVTGEVIAVMCMPNLMVTSKARDAVRDAITLAVSRGSRVVGLGALTAPATGAGASVLKDIPAGVTLTTGNAYTAAVAFHNVVDACKYLSCTDPNVAVVGCTGSVGFALSHLIARAGYRLTLVGRSEDRVRALFHGLRGSPTFSGTLEALRSADVTVILTNDQSAAICPEMFNGEGVIIDIAQPSNIPPNEYPAFESRGIHVFEGGQVWISGYSCTFDFSLPVSATFACLAETYLFSRENITEHSTGRASPELAVDLDRLARRHGVVPCPLKISTAPAGVCRASGI
jgi:fatty aldehyde-generating acyl-ACP reductase